MGDPFFDQNFSYGLCRLVRRRHCFGPFAEDVCNDQNVFSAIVVLLDLCKVQGDDLKRQACSDVERHFLYGTCVPLRLLASTAGLTVLGDVLVHLGPKTASGKEIVDPLWTLVPRAIVRQLQHPSPQ